MEVWTNGTLAYLPIPKNASTTFTKYFKGAGWQCTQLDLLDYDVKIFGHFQDPIKRHFKGTAEFLIQSKFEHLIDNPTWQKIFVHSVMDMHSMPITWAVGTRHNQIKWIPINRQTPTVLLTQKWLRAQGFSCDLENMAWYNQSTNHKLSLYYKLQSMHSTIANNGSLSYFYNNDIVLWNSLWPYIDEDNIIYQQF